jgi:hypothetical protein
MSAFPNHFRSRKDDFRVTRASGGGNAAKSASSERKFLPRTGISCRAAGLLLLQKVLFYRTFPDGTALAVP